MARIHYAPVIPRRKTLQIVSGIESLQNYFILCEAGFIEAPDIFIGGTNLAMARIATHFGFTMANRPRFPEFYLFDDECFVEGSSSSVQNAAFARETVELHAKLVVRLARNSEKTQIHLS